MKRRDFLVLTGAVGAAVAFDPILGLFVGGGAGVPEVIPGLENYFMTTCMMCPGGCGIKVRCVDGNPQGISGNPRHPVNVGGVCMEGLSALQLLYHDKRLTQPMKAKGKRGSYEFEPVSWDAALEAIVGKMSNLASRKAYDKLAFILGRSGGTMEDLVRHFMSSWGSQAILEDLPRNGYPEVLQAMHGLYAQPAFDFENTDFVLSFGADLLNAWESPVQFQRSYSSFRSAERNPKGTLAMADIRLSVTGAHAQEWIGITPGSHGALALGIAYVMLRENQHDAAFAEEHLHGFEDLEDSGGRGVRPGFRSLVLRDYSPEVVSRLTGIPVEKIINLGKAFGESRSSIALFDENVTAQHGGLYAGMAIHALNLLKGNLNRPGGLYLQPRLPLAPLGSAADAGTAVGGRRTIEELGSLVSAGGTEVAFIYYSNPISSSVYQRQLREALGKIGMVVSFSPFMDETSRYADFILPDALPLERWEDRPFPRAFPQAGWGVVQPCIPPAGECRHTGNVLLQLAQRLGGNMAAAMPWKEFQEILKHRAQGLYSARRGSPTTDSFDQGLLREIESRGWWISDHGNFDEFWQTLLQAGAWADPNIQVRSLHDYSGNPDGKIDLYSRDLHKRLARSNTSVADIECMPHYHSEGEPAAVTERPSGGGSAQAQLILNPYRVGKPQGGANGMLPWVRFASVPLDRLAGDPWAEINPQDAKIYSIRDLDWIWIESAAGKMRVRALVFTGAGPGVVHIPYGLQNTRRPERDEVSNPLELVTPERDPLSGLTYRFGTKVKIYKA